MHNSPLPASFAAEQEAASAPAPLTEAPVMQGLNLFLRLKSPAQMPDLLATVARATDQVHAALRGLHYVHFARFLPTPDGTMLLVITEFDGDLRSYIMDFVAVMGDVFSAILSFIAEAPPLPVQAYPEQFWQFILKNNLAQAQPWSAYGRSSVLDILGARRSLAGPAIAPSATPLATAATAPVAALDLSQVQANVLRGFRAERARHFAIRFGTVEKARAFLQALLTGQGAPPECPLIRAGDDWREAPRVCLNLGLTASGLIALGVPAAVMAQFPEPFRQGPAARAALLGDRGASAPEHWRLGGPEAKEHALLSLFGGVHHEAAFARAVAALEAAFAEFEITLCSAHDAAALPHGGVHFGYRDGIAQPEIAGLPLRGTADLQPKASPGEFLLGAGYVNQYGGNFLGGLPAALAEHGSYAAVRILRQDVEAFEALIAEVGARFTVDPEWVSAKLMGRWRNGEPLMLSPDAPQGSLAPAQLNHFDYAPNQAQPTYYDDYDGLRCPIGAHIRRLNPRGALVTGKPHSRRLIRRGMAYGPAFSADCAPGIERGLFGLFICGDLELQFEFMLRVWAQQNIATSGQILSSDPLLSTNGTTFTIARPAPAAPIAFFVPPLITTSGALYTFLPGMAGLANLARGAWGAAP